MSSFFFLPFTRHLLQKECSHRPHTSHPTASYHTHGRAAASCSSGLGLPGLPSCHLRRPLPIKTNLLYGPWPRTDGAPGSVISPVLPAQLCSLLPAMSALHAVSAEPQVWNSPSYGGPKWEEGLRSSTCSSEGKSSPATQSEHPKGVRAGCSEQQLPAPSPSPAAPPALLPPCFYSRTESLFSLQLGICPCSGLTFQNDFHHLHLNAAVRMQRTNGPPKAMG